MTPFQEFDSGANVSRAAMPKVPCTAAVGLTEAEVEQFSWGFRGAYAQMPQAGPGYDCYSTSGERHGLPEVIEAVKYVCAQWEKLYPNGPRVGIGDISLPNGGPMPPHASHDRGIDVDIALVANTNEEIGLTWKHPKYSRERTQQLIDLFLNNPILGIRVVFFNDPKIRGVEPWAGHDNHFHVSFLSPGVSAAAFSSDQQGYLRLVAPRMKGEQVRKLQADLVKVGMPIEVDGDFGVATDAAVRRFQAEQGLDVDGIVGPMTQAKLAQLVGRLAH